MAKIRRFKKDVKALASDLLMECETYIRFHPDADRNKTDKIIDGVQKKLVSLVYEINHFENKKNEKPKVYYQKIVDKVKTELIPLLDKIGDLEKSK